MSGSRSASPLSAETRAQIKEHMMQREAEHIRNVDEYRSQIEKLAQDIERKKTAFKNHLGIRNDQKLTEAINAFEDMRTSVSAFINNMDDIRLQALECSGVIFDEPKSISKKVEFRKRSFRERVDDLTNVAKKLHTSLTFASNLRSFETILQEEGSQRIWLASRKICPFCQEYVVIEDWVKHAIEVHSREKRMDLGQLTRRESFDLNNAREEAGRRLSSSSSSSNSSSIRGAASGVQRTASGSANTGSNNPFVARATPLHPAAAGGRGGGVGWHGGQTPASVSRPAGWIGGATSHGTSTPHLNSHSRYPLN